MAIRHRLRTAPWLLFVGLAATGTGWGVMWGVVSFWNALAFAAMWTGAALLMWAGSGRGYPGWRRHIALALISVPVWWWFELVNQSVRNWDYVHPFDFSPFWFGLLSSIAFTTVVPALIAATALVRRFFTGQTGLSPASMRLSRLEIAIGVILQGFTFAFPTQMYPFVWIAPFLVIDGFGGLVQGRSLAADLIRGRWREAAVIGGAGLLCGVLWEFWNFWSTPSWEYDIPLLGFWKVFQMPILGYGGYVPFAWSIVRLVDLFDGLWVSSRGYRRQTHRTKAGLAVGTRT